MADFQSAVNIYPAIGVPGAFASNNPVVSTALGRIANTTLTIGGFCWDDTSNPGQVKNTGSGKPLGFVARDIIYPINTLVAFPEDGTAGNTTNMVPIGGSVNVQVQGDFYVEAPATVTAGQKVFANTADGTVNVGNAGATVSSAVETDWAYATSGNKGDIVIISNYGATTTANHAISADSATTATKLATARTITLSGTTNGNAQFDGSQNITITTTSE